MIWNHIPADPPPRLSPILKNPAARVLPAGHRDREIGRADGDFDTGDSGGGRTVARRRVTSPLLSHSPSGYDRGMEIVHRISLSLITATILLCIAQMICAEINIPPLVERVLAISLCVFMAVYLLTRKGKAKANPSGPPPDSDAR